MSDVFEGRNAEILESIINDTEYTAPPESRIEELLLELKEVIEHGGGGTVTLSQLIQQVTGYPLNDYASMSLYSKDLNTITKSGFYNAMTCTNAPFDYMTLTVIGYYLEGYTVQIACDVTTGDIKKRNNINGTWSAWATTKELPAVTSDDNDSVLMVKEGIWDKGNVSGGSGINYSTTEQDTGQKWIDGKTIYQKTVVIPIISIDGWSYINLGFTPDTIIKFEGVLCDGSSIYDLNYNRSTSIFFTSLIASTDGVWQFNIYKNYPGSLNGFVTLFYTKPTT